MNQVVLQIMWYPRYRVLHHMIIFLPTGTWELWITVVRQLQVGKNLNFLM